MKEYDAKKQIQLGEYPYKVKCLQKSPELIKQYNTFDSSIQNYGVNA